MKRTENVYKLSMKRDLLSDYRVLLYSEDIWESDEVWCGGSKTKRAV